MRHAPEMVEVKDTQLEEVLRRVEQALDEKDAKLIRAVFQSYAYVADLVEDKNTSIRRLRELFFGKRTEKTKTVVGPRAADPNTPPSSDTSTDRDKKRGQRRLFRHLCSLRILSRYAADMKKVPGPNGT
jgi:hypothetical protein